MSNVEAKRVTIEVSKTVCVSGLWQRPSRAWSCLIVAPGAGAGIEHPFMAEMAAELNALGIATLRYQFPYMERGGRRPDPPALCHATVRAAAQVSVSYSRGLPRFAGGKSFGGRMTSQAQVTADKLRLEASRAHRAPIGNLVESALIAHPISQLPDLAGRSTVSKYPISDHPILGHLAFSLESLAFVIWPDLSVIPSVVLSRLALLPTCPPALKAQALTDGLYLCLRISNAKLTQIEGGPNL
jgi:hypothetical protein